jgi:hypothetical protein
VPTTSLNPIIVAGVKIESRYGKVDELELMHRFVFDLSPNLRLLVAYIFCDSNASYCFSGGSEAGS